MKHKQLILMLAAVMGLVVLPVGAVPFCGGESAPTRVDLRTGQVRDAAPTETLTYTVNDQNGTAKGASVDIMVNGVTRWSGLTNSGHVSGHVEWTLSEPGTNTLRQIVKDASGGEVTNYTARFVSTRPFVSVDVPAVANMTCKIVYTNGVEAMQGMVLSNETATVVYTADEEYMFESGETELTFALDTSKSPAEIVGWQDPGALVPRWLEERTLVVDTRARIIVASPEAVLPIAYSTNFWATSEDYWQLCESVSVSVTDPSGARSNIVSKTKSNGFSEWKPSEGAFGRYSLKHSTFGAVTHDVGAEIYYSKYSRLTVTPAEGGTVVAITNGVAATGAFDVLGYEYVDLKATPADATWQFAEWSVVTNGGAVALLWDETHPTNRFEMPLVDVTAAGRFVISGAYRDTLFNAATNAYVATSNAVESLRNRRLTDAEVNALLNGARGALSAAGGTLAAATRPSDADAATNTLAVALDAVTRRATAVSDAKPWTVTVDATAAADGTNVFNTIDAAFAATDFLPYATNLVVIGEQRATTAMPTMAFDWNLVVSNWHAQATYDDAKSPYRQTRLVLGEAAQTQVFLDHLATVAGEGRILVDRAGDDSRAVDFATTLNGKAAAGEKVEAMAVEQTLTLSDVQIGTEQVAIDAIILDNVAVTNRTALSAPGVAQNEGFFAWDLKGDNHATCLVNFDDVSFDDSVERQIQLDADQTDGAIITNYVIASMANRAIGKAFTLKDAADNTVCKLTVGGGTLYAGSKAYTLALVEDGEHAGTSNLVFTIGWGRFAITYEGMAGKWSDGSETNVVDAYVHKGYEFPSVDPARDNYTFDGWFRTWSNRAERVAAGNVTASPVQPLAAHALYAQWTPVSTDVTDSDIAIPDTLNEAPVLAIDAYAYAQASHPSQAFETLVTPLYLQSIGKGAFQGVKTLKTLIVTPPRSFDDPRVPVSLSIGQQAFASCTALEEVRIPGEVASIGNSAFQNCAKLKRVLFTGTSAIAYGSKAFYRCGYDNGEGELKVYMKSGFKANNAALLADFANWNTTLTVVPLVGVSPASGESPTISATDFGALGTDRKVALLVKVPTLIPGTKPDVDSVVIKHSTDLKVWNALVPESATAAEDGTVLVEFAVSEGANGFFKLEIVK